MRAPLLVLLTVNALGCELSPEDPLFFYGRVQGEDGAPLADAALTLERAGTRGGGQREVLEFAPLREVRTNAEGRFVAEILVGETSGRGPAGNDYPMRFRLAVPRPGGEQTELSFGTSTGDAELPELTHWTSGLSVSSEGASPRFTWAPLPPTPVLPPTMDAPSLTLYGPNGEVLGEREPQGVAASLQLHAELGLIWHVFPATAPVTVSPHVLEDFSGPKVQVAAVASDYWNTNALEAQLLGTNGAVDWRLGWWSPRLPLSAGALVPASRGAACTPILEEGAPCPWTDGSPEYVTLIAEPVRGEPFPLPLSTNEVQLTFASPLRPRHVVVRGLDPLAYDSVRVRLEGSADGTRWTVLDARTLQGSFDTFGRFEETFFYGLPENAALVSHFYEVALPEGTGPFSSIRLVGEPNPNSYDLGYFRGLAEISVFE